MSGGTGRYTGRVDSAFLDSLEMSGFEAVKGDDIYSPPLRTGTSPQRRRVSPKAPVKLQTSLSDRDLAVLDTLRQFRLATIAQLQVMHFADHASRPTANRVARRVLSRLVDQGLVDRLERRIGGVRAGSAGYIFRLSPVGYRAVGETTRKRRYEPKGNHVHHTLAITELACQVIQHCRERELELEKLQTEPMCWRSFGAVHQAVLKPDLYLNLADHEYELSWFVEVDLATESGTVLARKLSVYTEYWRSGEEEVRSGVFPRVLWIAPDQKRANFIGRVIAETSHVEPRLFTITTMPKAHGVLSNFGEET